MPTKKTTPESQVTIEAKIAEISADARKIEVQTKNAVTIKTEADMGKAVEVLAQVKARQKKIEEWRKFFVDPLNKHVKEINARFKEQAAPYDNAENLLKAAIGDYRQEQEIAARKEEERLRKLQEKREERAVAQGKEIEFKPLPTVERPQNTVHTESGKSTMVKRWKFQVADETKVPREYCIPDDRKIRAAVAAGVREIAGIRIYEDFDVNVTASM